MRVGDLTLYDSLAGQLETQQSSIDTLDSELSSGYALQQPSDDPVGVVDALSYQSQVSQLASTTSAASTASSWLGIANSTANSVISTMQTVQTLMLQALNSGGQNASSYNAIADQITGITQQLVGLGNTTYAGQAIFAGTAGTQTPYDSSGNYSGNQSSFTIQVGAGAATAVSVPGTSLFGGAPGGGTQSVFTTLQNFATHLAAGPGTASSSAIETDLQDLDANLSLAESAATTLGEASDSVQDATTQASNASTEVQGNLANLVDVNVATATTQLQSQLASYQSALYAVSQTIPESLAQYLH